MAGAVLLALAATGIGFVLGLVLLYVLGEKAWHHAVALSVGVFFVVFIALVAKWYQLALIGTVVVSLVTLLFWYAGGWTSLAVLIGAVCSCITLWSISGAWPQAPPPGGVPK